VAEVPGQTQQLEAGLGLAGGRHQLVAPVTAPVVDEDHLDRPVEPVEQQSEPAEQLGERLLLVVNGDDQRVLRDWLDAHRIGRASILKRVGTRFAPDGLFASM
jgi:hypothetical protein